MPSRCPVIDKKGIPQVSFTRSLIARRRDEEEGFTLIELMVVVLIIAILIAIAIPTFLGARKRAQDRAAQSSIRNELTAAKTLYTDKEDFSSVSVANLGSVEPSLTPVAGASGTAGPKTVGFAVSGAGTQASQILTLNSYSKSGSCFWLQDVEVDGTVTPTGVQYAVDSNNACGAAPAAWNASW
jgi:type IV pilus assembly protein PilA